MNKLIKLLLVSTLVVAISACQTTAKKTQKSPSATQQTNELFKSIVSNALQEKQYQQAEKALFGLMINAKDVDWAFIQTGIQSLPNEYALRLMENALKNPNINQSSSNLFNISKTYIAYQDTDRALTTINKAINLDSKNLEALYWRARLQTVLKNFEEARKDFQHVIKKDPTNQKYQEQYASLLQELEEFEAAQDVLKDLNPSIQNYYKQIIFALQNENKDQAQAAYKKLKAFEAVKDQQNDKHFYVGEAAYWLNDWKTSEENYKKVNGGENYLNSRQMLSFILFEQNRDEEAVELLHQLQNAELEYSTQAYLLESQIYSRQNNKDQAIETLSNSLELIPDNKEILYNRAMLFESKDEIDKTKKDLLKAIEIDPKFAEAYNALGYSMADRGMDLNQAHTYISKALELNPENAAILDSMGWVLYKQGKIEEAETYLLKAQAKDYKDVEIYTHLHEVQTTLGKTKEASETLIKAKELFSDNKKFLEYLITIEN